MNWNSNVEKNDNLQVFLVFKFNKIPPSGLRDGIIGHDNYGYDWFIAVKNNKLIVSGTENDVITIESDEDAKPLRIDQFCVLSVH